MAESSSVRVALAQMNSSVGAFAQNSARILAYVRKAAEEGVKLVIFPELTLSSYPCLDLVDRQDFIDTHGEALEQLIRDLGKIKNAPVVVLGAITKNKAPIGRALRNSALTVVGGEVVHQQDKQLLPTYDVFDERRYFEPAEKGSIWQSESLGSVGVSVCEDAWYSDLHRGRAIYPRDPADALNGARLAVNISSSPYQINKQHLRDQTVSKFAQKVGAPLLYVNQVGANDELLFDGNSRILNSKGEKLLEAPSFVEGLMVCDLNPKAETVSKQRFIVPSDPVTNEIKSWSDTDGSEVLKPRSHVAPREGNVKEIDYALLSDALISGIRDYFLKTGFSKAVIGLSGGIDSAVVAVLAARALGPQNVYGVSMPSQFSSSHSLDDAAALARNLGIEYGVASIKFVNSALLMELKNHFGGAPKDETEENLQSRLRGDIVMAIANKRRALVLTTGNKSELGVGYCTIYGDMCGAIAPLGDLYKTAVYGLAHFMNRQGEVIPHSTLTKAPSAELRPGQTDQDSLPPYEMLDEILRLHIEDGQGMAAIVERGFEKHVVEQVLRLVRISEFKRRQAAPSLKVTTKAFGIGRRYPVAKGF